MLRFLSFFVLIRCCWDVVKQRNDVDRLVLANKRFLICVCELMKSKNTLDALIEIETEMHFSKFDLETKINWLYLWGVLTLQIARIKNKIHENFYFISLKRKLSNLTAKQYVRDCGNSKKCYRNILMRFRDFFLF